MDWGSSRALTFDCPANAAASLCDTRATEYLAGLLSEIRAHQGWTVLPLRTLADGSCLVNAVAMAVWGSEAPAASLRAAACEELATHAAWYTALLEQAHPGRGASEHAEACARAAAAGSFLSNVHILALANLLQRPIILVASQDDMQRSGVRIVSFYTYIYSTYLDTYSNYQTIYVSRDMITLHEIHHLPVPSSRLQRLTQTLAPSATTNPILHPYSLGVLTRPRLVLDYYTANL